MGMLSIPELVIDALSVDVALLLERVAHLESERDSYRDLAQQSIHALHDVVGERDQLRGRNRQLIEENRELRGFNQVAA